MKVIIPRAPLRRPSPRKQIQTVADHTKQDVAGRERFRKHFSQTCRTPVTHADRVPFHGCVVPRKKKEALHRLVWSSSNLTTV